MADRPQTKNIVSYIVILGIALVFIFEFGPGNSACNAPLSKRDTDVAAVVNGADIPSRDFNNALAERVQQMNVPEELARQFGVARNVMDSLIDRELLEQTAEKQGIVASDSELAELIHKIPNFQIDGKFDFTQYSNVVRENLQQTVPFYETNLRRQLSANKLLATVAETVAVSDDEVHAGFLKNGNKANALVVRFQPAMFAEKVSKVSDADVSAYQKAHAKEIEAYYASNKATYHQGERVHARHILVKLAKDASVEQKAEARKKAEALRQEVTGGKDFAEVAKASSEDPGSKIQGGDLGTQEKSAWVPAFSDAAFALKPSEVSPVVESPFGFHIIQSLEKKPAEDRSLEQVRNEIATQLLRMDRAKALAKTSADKALAGLASGKLLKDLYPSTKTEETSSQFEVQNTPEAVETGEFSVGNGDSIPQVGTSKALADDIAAAEGPMALKKVYPVGEGFVVAQLVERKRPTDKEFADQREKLRTQTLDARRMEVIQSYTKALRKTASIKVNEALAGPKLGQG